MDRIKIKGDNLQLILLLRTDLEMWLADPRNLSHKLALDIDNKLLDNQLKRIFNIKILKMELDPGYDYWFSYFAIVTGDKIIGTIGFKGRPDINNCVEVGYGITKENYNKGYTSEALKLFYKYFFNEFKIDKIIAKTSFLNIASQKVLKKNGFIKIKAGKEIQWALRNT